MSAVILKSTQSSQVATKLESMIGSGKFAVGRKMPSTRELANRFDVSQQVIKSAMGVLEERSLIIKKPRVGIFVNPAILSRQRDFFMLGSRDHNNPDKDDYSSLILSITSHDVWKNLNLSTRYISSDQMNAQVFQYELDKIISTSPDCLLTSQYTPETAPLLQNLPFPVVILGDADKSNNYPEPANQLTESTGERSEFLVDAAVARGCKNVAMISGCPTYRSWGKLLVDGGKTSARKAGINFFYSQHSARKYDRTVNNIIEHCNNLDGLIIDGFIHIDKFIAEFAKNGYIAGKNLKVFCDGEMVQGTNFVKYDYRELSRAIIKRVEYLLEHPGSTLGRVVLPGLIRRSIISLEHQI